jgi:hypothetical protein
MEERNPGLPEAYGRPATAGLHCLGGRRASWNRMNRTMDLRPTLVVALLPLVLLGLLAVVMQVHGMLRYDPVYFTEPYLERYSKPDLVVKALERALQTDDRALLAELQGLRSPRAFETAPSIDLAMLLERNDFYLTYLYVDRQTYDRYTHHLEKFEGRWIVSPDDAYFFVRSGQWQRIFLPAALAWWILGSLALIWRQIQPGWAAFRDDVYGRWT